MVLLSWRNKVYILIIIILIIIIILSPEYASVCQQGYMGSRSNGNVKTLKLAKSVVQIVKSWIFTRQGAVLAVDLSVYVSVACR